jgi:hypothetical protein
MLSVLSKQAVTLPPSLLLSSDVISWKSSKVRHLIESKGGDRLSLPDKVNEMVFFVGCRGTFFFCVYLPKKELVLEANK